MQYIQFNDDKTVSSLPIALVVSRFNENITHPLKEGALKQLQLRGVNLEDITVIDVPGAIEIPLVVKRLAIQQNHKAIIALGAVIRGETSHYDYVCQQVSQGCQQISLQYDVPVIFGVLTTENEWQAKERVGGKEGHKGVEAANAAISMNEILTQLDLIQS